MSLRCAIMLSLKIVSFCLLLSNEWFGFKIKVTIVHSDEVCTPEEWQKFNNPVILRGITLFLGVRTSC